MVISRLLTRTRAFRRCILRFPLPVECGTRDVNRSVAARVGRSGCAHQRAGQVKIRLGKPPVNQPHECPAADPRRTSGLSSPNALRLAFAQPAVLPATWRSRVFEVATVARPRSAWDRTAVEWWARVASSSLSVVGCVSPARHRDRVPLVRAVAHEQRGVEGHAAGRMASRIVKSNARRSTTRRAACRSAEHVAARRRCPCPGQSFRHRRAPAKGAVVFAGEERPDVLFRQDDLPAVGRTRPVPGAGFVCLRHAT